MHRNDPAVRRVLARLRLARMELRREQKHVLQNTRQFTCSASTDVLRTFRMYDFTPPSELRRIAS